MNKLSLSLALVISLALVTSGLPVRDFSGEHDSEHGGEGNTNNDNKSLKSEQSDTNAVVPPNDGEKLVVDPETIAILQTLLNEMLLGKVKSSSGKQILSGLLSKQLDVLKEEEDTARQSLNFDNGNNEMARPSGPGYEDRVEDEYLEEVIPSFGLADDVSEALDGDLPGINQVFAKPSRSEFGDENEEASMLASVFGVDIIQELQVLEMNNNYSEELEGSGSGDAREGKFFEVDLSESRAQDNVVEELHGIGVSVRVEDEWSLSGSGDGNDVISLQAELLELGFMESIVQELRGIESSGSGDDDEGTFSEVDLSENASEEYVVQELDGLRQGQNATAEVSITQEGDSFGDQLYGLESNQNVTNEKSTASLLEELQELGTSQGGNGKPADSTDSDLTVEEDSTASNDVIPQDEGSVKDLKDNINEENKTNHVVKCTDLHGRLITLQPEDLCDGVSDCFTGWDESPLTCSRPCIDTYTKCDDGFQCVKEQDICDGVEQCRDGSDELQCGMKTKDCSKHDEFACDGICRPKSDLCDATFDCTSGIDELGCDYVAIYSCPRSFSLDPETKECFPLATTVQPPQKEDLKYKGNELPEM
ncbi:uncharacterized protein [Ptychodera flava]|uniref:uncharacterized protein n=1 Tax=Ptychodera flava TaxID=63121 RepID=UPI00396A4E5C